MRRSLALMLIAFTALAMAQTKKPPAAGAHKPASAAAKAPGARGLPSRATVDAFMRHVFGWEPEIKLTVKEIKASAAPGLAEIVISAQTPQGNGDRSLYVTADQKHIISGQMFPFGGQANVKPTEEQINAFVRQMTQGSSGITWSVYEVKQNEISNLTGVTVLLKTPQGQGGQHFWVTADGQHALVGDAGPFAADPYAAARAELAKANGPSKGAAVPKITIIEFADLQCPACKAAMPTVERLVKEIPGTKLIFQQFPLTQMHHWAFKAAEFGDCIARTNNEAFWKYVELVYANQEQVLPSNDEKQVESTAVPKLKDYATQAGANGQQVAACAADPATANRITASMELGKKMEVTGTPTLFVNGRKIGTVGSMPWEQLKKLVEFMGTQSAK